MIDKIKGKYHLICDICGEEAGETFDSFDEAVDFKVDSGWISQKRNGEWQNVCPDCYPSGGEEAMKLSVIIPKTAKNRLHKCMCSRVELNRDG